MTNVFPDMSVDPVDLPVTTSSNFRPVLVISTFIALTCALMAGAAGSLHFLFPAMATVVGLYLYRSYPAFYVSFVLWMWFLSPFVRRVVDYRSYWMDANPILLAPAIVTIICAVTFIKNVNRSWHSSLLPYLLIASGITMGLIVGIVLGKPVDAAATYLLWIAPLCFGYYLQTFPLEVQQLKKTIVKTFVGSVVVCGSYALFQFVTAPAWDCNWLEMVSLNSVSPSFGKPNPFELRVWSTLNAPGPFSVALMVGLLMLFVYSGWAKLPAIIVGYASFLLCMVRTSWLSWLVAMALIAYFNRRRLYNLILPLLGLSIIIACLTQWPPIADQLHDRFASAAGVGSDESVIDRKHLYDIMPNYLLSHPMGRGLSNSPVFEGRPLDSGLLSTPLQLGWLGTLLVILGLTIQLLRCRIIGDSLTFERVCQFAAFALLIQIAGSQVFGGLSALLLWSLCGLVVGREKQFIQLSVLVED